ncbi:MAG: NAD-dependent epimerase/dehydratase family protein [Candidatus Omnitrophota bacterium]
MNILITGATGFIGRHLVDGLIKRGIRPKLLIRRTSRIDYFKDKPVEFIYADILNFDSLKDSFSGVDIVFHCAAEVSGGPRDKLFTANVVGTENVCRAALDVGIKKLIYLSSVAVISGNNQNPLTDDLPYLATNLYGVSKIEAERIALDYRNKGLAVAIFRPCMVYGEDEPHVLGLLLKLIKLRLLPIIGSGEKLLHLVYVENVVKALLSAIDKDEAFNGTYIVADKEIFTAEEFLNLLADTLKVMHPWHISSCFTGILSYLPVSLIKNGIKFYSKDRSYDISRIEKFLDYRPLPTREAVIKTVREFRWKK